MSIVVCACPRTDARDCARFRSDRAGMYALFGDEPPPDDDEACDCDCHDVCNCCNEAFKRCTCEEGPF